MIRSRRRSLLAAIVVLALGSGCEERGPSAHARMIAALDDVVARTPEENWILGDRLAREVRAHLEALPENAAPRQRIPLWLQLGDLELQLGNLDEGIALLTQAHERLEKLSERRLVRTEVRIQSAYRLAVGYLRLGETENCCLRHFPESCILPIRGDAVHTETRGSSRAIEFFQKVLELAPEESPEWRKAQWLVNVAFMTLGDYPAGVPQEFLIPPGAIASDEEWPLFENVAPALGLDMFDLAGGVIADDFDGDDLFDLLVSTWDPNGQIRLFRNEGTGGFADVTEDANLVGIRGGFNLTQADYDNDGDLDAFVLRGAWLGKGGAIPNSLLRNDGGRFVDVTFDVGLGEVHYPTQTATWADFDRDGDVDLYIGNEPMGNRPAPCQLFRNEGNGTFVDVAEEAGVTNLRYTKAVAWGDADADGWPDLYVSNLDMKNRLYRNRGDGKFADVAEEWGMSGPRASFPVWFWDYDNDGALDLFVAGYDWQRGNLAAVAASQLGIDSEHATPSLYRGDGNGSFRDVAAEVNLDRVTLPMGANFGDLDGDGWLDFYLGTGYPDYEALMPNVMMRNRQGREFANITLAGGFGHLQKGHGIAFVDLDNDGDQDVYEQMGGFYSGDKFGNALFENPGFDNRWVSIKLVGTRSSRSAIGARIRVTIRENGRERSIYKHVNSGGSFGANPLRQTIGLGRAEEIVVVEVTWPATGDTDRFQEIELDRVVEIVEGEAAAKVLHLPRFQLRSGT